LLAARATLACALERRESRGAQIRLDYPDQDPQLGRNLVWALDAEITLESPAEPSPEVAWLAAGEVDIAGRLLE
jgi:succinate dehydrogenase / fumarate reductase flavoprotein subunit